MVLCFQFGSGQLSLGALSPLDYKLRNFLVPLSSQGWLEGWWLEVDRRECWQKWSGVWS